MSMSSKRGEQVSVACFVAAILFAVIALLVGRWSGFFAVSAVGWLILSAALIWLVLTIQFHQQWLAEQEKLDATQLAADKHTSAIFQQGNKNQDLFVTAKRRLDIFEKWFLPIFAAIIAIYQAGMGLYLLKGISSAASLTAKQPLVCVICMTAIAFISFLLSRYATGMSAQPKWKPLRAGGSIFLSIALLCFALAVGLAMVQFKMFVVVNVINYCVAVLLMVLGVETVLNVIMDIYRPRIKGRYNRSAFDSRLLGIINEPGKIARTASGAIDYQFGFQVSQTWFYKLLEKAVVPLVLFAAVTLYLFSGVVVVEPDQQAIIEHFGNPINSSGEARIAEPGLSFKWPWPIDIAYKYPVKRVSQVNIGFVPKETADSQKVGYGPLLWGKAHYEEEYLLLVASEQTTGKLDEGAVPVSLVMAAVPVQYRIKDLYSFVYNHAESEKLLEAICYRELTRFAASAKIEVENNSEASLLGAGRARAKQILTDRVQAAADEAGLGVEIVFLGLQGIHPPPEVAEDYQKVIGAVQTKQALILHAQAEHNKTLSSLAGSVQEADELYSIAEKYQKAKDEKDTQQIQQLSDELDAAFAGAKGEIFSTLRNAQSYAFEKITLAKATGQRFESQIKAYKAAPEIYKREQRLAVLEQALENTRKYVVVADQNDTQVFIVDVKEKLTPSLYELSGFEEGSGK